MLKRVDIQSLFCYNKGTKREREVNKMTVKELREKLSQFDDDVEVAVYDTDGYWSECNRLTFVPTDDYYIEKDTLILETIE